MAIQSSRSQSASVGTQVRETARELLTADEVRRLPRDVCILFTEGNPPILGLKLDVIPLTRWQKARHQLYLHAGGVTKLALVGLMVWALTPLYQSWQQPPVIAQRVTPQTLFAGMPAQSPPPTPAQEPMPLPSEAPRTVQGTGIPPLPPSWHIWDVMRSRQVFTFAVLSTQEECQQKIRERTELSRTMKLASEVLECRQARP